MKALEAGLSERRLMLGDLIQISSRPLPDREQFLSDWIALLRAQEGSDADRWLREGIRLSQGLSGLEALARSEGRTRPHAYLDWFAELRRQGRHREVLRAAQDALRTLPADFPSRASIADYVHGTASSLGEEATQLAARWEAFLAEPTLARLLDLWDAAPTVRRRTELLEEAARHLHEVLARPPERDAAVGAFWTDDELGWPRRIDKSVLAHAYLLAGNLEAARDLAAAEAVLGWSSGDNPQGLIVCYLLVLLSGRTPDDLPFSLAELWEWALLYSTGAGDWRDVKDSRDPLCGRLQCVYEKQLSTQSLGDDQQRAILDWCMQVVSQRVDAIVGPQHRRSYHRAAMLAIACAELLQLRGCQEAGRLLAEGIRKRFSRHRAFQEHLRPRMELMQGGHD
jgi:hypothetical protein